MSIEALKFDQIKAHINRDCTWDRVVNNMSLDYYKTASASKITIMYPTLNKHLFI